MSPGPTQRGSSTVSTGATPATVDPADWDEQFPVDRPDVPEIEEQLPAEAYDNSIIGGFAQFMDNIVPDDMGGMIRGSSGWLANLPLYEETLGKVAYAPFGAGAEVLDAAAWGSEQLSRLITAAVSAAPGGIQTLTWEQTEDVSTFQAAVTSVGIESKRIREGGARPSDLILLNPATLPFMIAGYLAEDSPVQADGFDILNTEQKDKAFSQGWERFFSGLGDAGTMVGTDPFIILGGASSVIRYGTKAGKVAGIANQQLVTPRQVDNFALRLREQAALIDELGVDGARASGRLSQEGENLVAAMRNDAADNSTHIWVRNSNNEREAQALLGRTSVENPQEAAALVGAMAGHADSWAQLRNINPQMFDDLAIAHGVDVMVKVGPKVPPPSNMVTPITDDAVKLADDMYRQALYGNQVGGGQMISRGGSRGSASSAVRAANAWRSGKAQTQFERNPFRRTSSSTSTAEKGHWAYDFIEGVSSSRPITAVRWLGKGAPSGVLFLKGDDLTTSNREIKAWLAKSGIDADQSRNFYNRYVATRTVDERKQLVEEMEEAAVAGMAAKQGVSPSAAKKAYDTYVTKRANALGQIQRSDSKLYVDPDNGEIVKVPAFYGDLDQATPLLDTKIFRRVLADNRIYKYGEDATIAADYVNSLWKVSVLLRLGYTQRNIAEGALRSFAALGLIAANPKAWATAPSNAVFRARQFGKTRDLRKTEKSLKATYDQLLDARKVLVAARTDAGVDDWQKLIREANDFGPEIRRLQRKAKTKSGLSKNEKKKLASLERQRQRRMDKAADIKQSKIDPATPELTRLQRQGSLLELELDGQLARVQQTIEEIAKLQSKRRLTGRKGNRMDDGTVMPGAFEGDAGAIAAMLSSADRSVYATFQWGAGARADILRDAADFKKLDPKDLSPKEMDNYWAEYTTRVNNRFRQDELARMILAGKSITEIRKFLLSPNGVKYREQLSVQGRDLRDASDINAYIDDVYQKLNYEVPDVGTFRQTLLEREVTSGELMSWLSGSELPVITGRLAGESPQGFTGLFKGLNNITGVAMKWLGTIPETKLLRHPFYNSVYTARQRQLYNLAYKQGLDMTDETVLGRINRAAHRDALGATRDTMYTIERLSNAGEMLRFVSPFFPAWENSIRTWGRLAYQKPQIVGYGNILWNIPNNLGWVVDDKGEKVERSSFLKDEGQYIIWPKPMQDFMQKKFGPFTPGQAVMSRQQGLNVIFPGGEWWFPGVGPMSQIPTSLVLRGKPEDQEILKNFLGEELYNQITPMGNVNNDLIDSLSPTVVRRLRQMYNGTSAEGAYLTSYNNILEDAYIQAQIDDRTLTEADYRRIDQQANDFWRWQVLAAAGFPFQMKQMSQFQVERDDWARLIDDQSIPYPDKVKILTDKYGIEFAAITRSGTFRETKLQPNLKTWERITKYPELVERLNAIEPELVGMFGNMGSWDDPFSYAVYGEFQQHSIGSNRNPVSVRMRPMDIARNNEVRDGWDAYWKIKDALEEKAIAAGYSGLQVKAAEPLQNLLDEAERDISERYPAWGEERIVYTQKLPQFILGARIFVANADLMEEDSTIRALSRYMQLRDGIADALGNTSDDDKRKQIRELAYEAAFEIRQSDIGFADFYDQYLARDDFRKVL